MVEADFSFTCMYKCYTCLFIYLYSCFFLQSCFYYTHVYLGSDWWSMMFALYFFSSASKHLSTDGQWTVDWPHSYGSLALPCSPCAPSKGALCAPSTGQCVFCVWIMNATAVQRYPETPGPLSLLTTESQQILAHKMGLFCYSAWTKSENKFKKTCPAKVEV